MFIFKIGNFLLLWLTLTMIIDQTRQQKKRKKKKSTYSTERAIKLRLNTPYGLIFFPFSDIILLYSTSASDVMELSLTIFCCKIIIIIIIIKWHEYTRSHQVSIQNWCFLVIMFSIQDMKFDVIYCQRYFLFLLSLEF